MGLIEQRLGELGLRLPGAPLSPPGFRFPFSWIRVHRNRVFASGHGPITPDGKPAGPFGKVPSEVSFEDAQHAARGAALTMLGNLQRVLGDLDRVTAWLMVQGMVNADVGYAETGNVVNAFSDLILDLYGHEVGHHARVEVGMAALPLNLPVVVAAELEIA